MSVATVSCLNDVWLVHWYRQIDYDCKFLESRGIMDYSMLLGLHFRAPQYWAPLSPGPLLHQIYPQANHSRATWMMVCSPDVVALVLES